MIRVVSIAFCAPCVWWGPQLGMVSPNRMLTKTRLDSIGLGYLGLDYINMMSLEQINLS